MEQIARTCSICGVRQCTSPQTRCRAARAQVSELVVAEISLCNGCSGVVKLRSAMDWSRWLSARSLEPKVLVHRYFEHWKSGAAVPHMQFAPKMVGREWVDGQLAIIEQLICVGAAHFVGTADSTFTLRIAETRLLQGASKPSSSDVLCRTGHECPPATSFMPKGQVRFCCSVVTPTNQSLLELRDMYKMELRCCDRLTGVVGFRISG